VLIMSFKSNQKKTLCFIWHLEFQSHAKIGWVGLSPTRKLYVLAVENLLFPHLNVQRSVPSKTGQFAMMLCNSANCSFASRER
jgi:hypothetical protein